ncbi:unnamed protein product [Coregonus sp. 'balchen']|nr:unnamed protein product [Coregonus sp. 'balchen']
MYVFFAYFNHTLVLSLSLSLSLPSSQRLQEKVKEGNLDPRESAVAMEAQVSEDISLSVSQVLSCRHFCNKMWQTQDSGAGALGQIDTVHTGRGSQRESQMVRVVLYHCVSVSLALLSPFMPFLTEELWQRLHLLRGEGGDGAMASLCLQPYPQSAQLAHWHFPQEEADFTLVQEVVRVARSLRAQCGMTKEKPDMWAVCSPSQAQILLHFDPAVRTLGRITKLHLHCPQGAGSLSFPSAPPPPKGSAVGVVDHSCQLHLNIQGGVNVSKLSLQLSQRREKLLSKLEQSISRTRVPNYLEKVPERVRVETENKISALDQELRNIEEQLSTLQGPPKHNN